jgi:hypothetical protein
MEGEVVIMSRVILPQNEIVGLNYGMDVLFGHDTTALSQSPIRAFTPLGDSRHDDDLLAIQRNVNHSVVAYSHAIGAFLGCFDGFATGRPRIVGQSLDR